MIGNGQLLFGLMFRFHLANRALLKVEEPPLWLLLCRVVRMTIAGIWTKCSLLFYCVFKWHRK